MDSFELDNFKAEKADAMRRYNRKQNLNYLLHVCGLLVFLFWSSKWINILHEITLAIDKPFFPFILINLLIILIFILSRQKPAQQQPNLYDEYVTNTNIASSIRRITAGGDSPTPMNSNQETHYYDKQVVSSSPKVQDSEPTVCPIQSDAVAETQDMVVVDLEPKRPSRVHEKMSDVEFNVAVSTYIYKQNKVWRQEKN